MNLNKNKMKGFSYSKSVGRDIKETVDEHDEEEESPVKEPSESTLNNQDRKSGNDHELRRS